MSSLFVFPGQGSQFVGMGDGLFEKYPAIVGIADKILGYSISELCLMNPRQHLNQTQYTQPALFTVSVLYYLDKMATDNVKADYLAGHSLGEYTALFAADAFDFETGLKIVKKRGELMAKAPPGAMAAVVNLNLHRVSELLADSKFSNIELANINTDSQNVLSGDAQEIIAAEQLFTDAGARYIPLKVSAGFHSRLMKNVAEEFYDYLTSFSLSPLNLPVISNITARRYPQTEYSYLMKNQIDHPVKWYETISWALLQGCEQIEEIGPGLVLTKMLRTIKEKPLIFNDNGLASQSFGKGDIEELEKIFMFAGQGSQYKNMGRELYTTNSIFRKHLDYANDIVIAKTGLSLVAELYHPRSVENVDDVRIKYPAILCLQYALAQMMINEGVESDAVIDHSLGEYVAAVIAKNISLESAVNLTIKQAELLFNNSAKGVNEY